ncbi:MAG TPA: hypothetical protein VF250_13035 [Conexibacter sp.]
MHTRQTRAERARDVAWLAAPPCALALAAIVVVLGPPLGELLFPAPSLQFWSTGIVRPEPTEHARFLIALIGPVALSGVVVAAARRPASIPGSRAAVQAAETMLLAFVAFAIVAQHGLAYRGAIGAMYEDHSAYFSATTLLAAVAIAALMAAALRSPAAFARLRAAARERPRRRRACLAIAVLFVAAWMLTAFNTEGSLGRAVVAVRDHTPYWLDETYAVLDGMHPLVDYHAQYAHLLPYVTAAAMAATDDSYGVFAALMVLGTTAAMLAVYATLRRLARSSAVALALFAPFVATSFFMQQGTLDNRYGPSNLFSLFPIRYGGPFVLAWLLARHLDGRRPRSRRLLFVAGGLVLLNNPEFGIPAFGATLAALGWSLERVSLRTVGRLAGDAALGLLAAIAAVTAMTLVVAGAPPDPSLLFEFSRIFGLAGFAMLPMPTIGLHLAIFVTLCAALVLATVRAVAGERDALTGMLCWIAVFGLGAGSYYAGRSHPEVLIDLFSAWALAIALLLIAAVRAIVRRPGRRPTPAELALFAGFGLTVCSIAQTPTPWSQVARLTDPTTAPTPTVRPLAAERFIDAHTRPGERVVIMVQLGHRIAHDLGLDDVFPYANIGSMPAVEQWRIVLAAIEEQDVKTVFVPTLFIPPVLEELRAAGFEIAAADRKRALVAKLTR